MSESQATRDPVAEFLSDLGAELSCSPSEVAARRHVKKAALTARDRRVRRRRLAVRSGAVAAAMTLVVSTSGVALAGGLPRPVQTMAADAARMLPVPLPIPYPKAPPALEMLQTETPWSIGEREGAAPLPVTPDDSAAANAEPIAGVDAGSRGSNADATQDRVRDTSGTNTDARHDEVETRRDWRDHDADDEEVWGSNEQDDRGWDDRRDRDRRGSVSNDRTRQEDDRDRSRDTNRDR